MADYFACYKRPFYFIGLDKIHDLSKAGFTELRIELEDWEGNTTFAQYNDFHISDSSDNYRLNISGFSGGAGMLHLSTFPRLNVDFINLIRQIWKFSVSREFHGP